MLDMGFIPDIERIFQLTPFTRQTLFFSATMAPEIERITNTFLHSPTRIEVARQATTSSTIEQRLIELVPTRKDQSAKQKRELLRAVIQSEGEACTNAILFCNRKTEVDILAKSLKTHGFDAAPIHGDLEQSQRTRTLDGFRDGSLRFLVASDVAARGLDIPAVSHVFNFDVPSHAEDYVHRIGRTGRAGRKGVAITLSTPSDAKYLAAIEALVKEPIPRGAIPEGFELSEAAQRPARKEEDRRGPNPKGRGDKRERQIKPHGQEASTVALDVPPIESAVAAPEEAPAAVSQRPERRERRNEGRSDNRRENRPERTPEAQPEVRSEPRSESRSDARPAQRHEHREDRRDDRRRNDHHRRRESDDEPVVGMGDHVPDFLMRGLARVETPHND